VAAAAALLLLLPPGECMTAGELLFYDVAICYCPISSHPTFNDTE